MNNKILIIIPLLAIGLSTAAQAPRGQLRQGNRQYRKQNYEQAEVSYRRALEQDSSDIRGQYNLGNALYRQKKYDVADSHYVRAITSPSATPKQKAHALHNRGNSLLQAGMENQDQQLLQQALASYQEALKLDPKNEDTRYNLALARHLLQKAQQQQQQQQQGGGDQKQQQQNQQQQNQGDNQQQQGNNNQQQQGQQQQQQNREGQRQQAQQDVKKRDAERMLEAMGNRERQTLRDRKRTDIPTKGRKTDKDW